MKKKPYKCNNKCFTAVAGKKELRTAGGASMLGGGPNY